MGVARIARLERAPVFGVRRHQKARMKVIRSSSEKVNTRDPSTNTY